MNDEQQQFKKYQEMLAVMKLSAAQILATEYPASEHEKIMYVSDKIVEVVMRCLR